MKIYNLTADENKLVSAIINDLTTPYKAYSMGRHHRKWFLDEPIAVNKRIEDAMNDLEDFAEEENGNY